MAENMNGLKHLQMIVQMDLLKIVNKSALWDEAITVIYKMFCNGRPICVVYSVSKVIPLSYFCGYILFNS